MFAKKISLAFYLVSAIKARKAAKRPTAIPVLKERFKQRFFGQPLHTCYGCSPSNLSGLKVKFFCTEKKDELVVQWEPRRDFESYPGVVHGGITATLLDEVAGATLQARKNVLAFTVTSNFHYIGPVKSSDIFHGKAKILSKRSNYYLVEAQAYREDGRVLAVMTALFYVPPADMIRKMAGDNMTKEVESYLRK